MVHTGVVRLVFLPDDHRIDVDHEAIAGPDALAISAWINDGPMYLFGGEQHTLAPPQVYVEKYRPRSHFDSDARMVDVQSRIKAALPDATLVLNTGVKKVVRRELMELFGVWQFATRTHHQDLRAAARIALFGMLKDEHLNRLVANVVRDHLDGRPWDVIH